MRLVRVHCGSDKPNSLEIPTFSLTTHHFHASGRLQCSWSCCCCCFAVLCRWTDVRFYHSDWPLRLTDFLRRCLSLALLCNASQLSYFCCLSLYYFRILTLGFVAHNHLLLLLLLLLLLQYRHRVRHHQPPKPTSPEDRNKRTPTPTATVVLVTTVTILCHAIAESSAAIRDHLDPTHHHNVAEKVTSNAWALSKSNVVRAELLKLLHSSRSRNVPGNLFLALLPRLHPSNPRVHPGFLGKIPMRLTFDSLSRHTRHSSSHFTFTTTIPGCLSHKLVSIAHKSSKVVGHWNKAVYVAHLLL